MSLDLKPSEFRTLMYETVDSVADFYEGLRDAPLFHDRSPVDVASLFEGSLPRGAGDPGELLTRVKRDLLSATSLNATPNFFAYVISCGNQMAILAEILRSGLNLCVSKWNLAASATELELCVIRWLAEFIGYPTMTGGVLTSGGSMGNLLCLAAMRNAMAPFNAAAQGLARGPRLLVYVSSEGHSCHQRTMNLLGLGSEQLIIVPSDNEFKMDCEELKKLIVADRAKGDLPIAVIGTGGSTNTGAVDPLDKIADICSEQGLWFHVDGAYGAPAAATELAGYAFVGLSRADSVAIDPHKWLYVQLEVGCALVKRPEHLRNAFHLTPDYLQPEADDDPTAKRHEWFDYTIQHTREFKALKVWMTLAAYGADRLVATIEDNIITMRYFADLVAGAPDFELIAPCGLSTVCFRYITTDSSKHSDEAFLAMLNSRLLTAAERDARVFLGGTVVRGKKVLRVCCVNHRTSRGDVEVLLRVLRQLGAECYRTLECAEQSSCCEARSVRSNGGFAAG